jgi:hypothetical protein
MKRFWRILLIGWLSSLWTELVSNWNILTSAPLVFVTSLVLGSTLAFIIIRWVYQERLSALNEQVNLGQERIRFKDEDIDRAESRLIDFREALRLEEPKSKYQLLTKKELKDRTLNTTNELRAFIIKWSITYRDNFKEKPSEALLTPECYLMQEYSKLGYEARLLSLRDELRKRLPEEYWSNTENDCQEKDQWNYSNPSRFSWLSFMVTDLERLAENLKI